MPTTLTVPRGTTASSPPPTTATAHGELVPGVYVDGPQGQPHYVVAVANNIGQVSFVYQDGRVRQVATFVFAAQASTLSAHFANGQTLSGRLGPGSFSITGCNAVLQFATQPNSCTFTHQGA